MKITIIYDNVAWRKDLAADWGFSCLVEAHGKIILFDTGAKGEILLQNMKKLDIDPRGIHEIFISHAHWDHTGGLSEILEINPARVYAPRSFTVPSGPWDVTYIKEASEIGENFYSTGELSGMEQSLVISTQKGLCVVVGCSHPGLENILEASSQFGKNWMVVGGLHGFSNFKILEDLEFICPTHCTRHIDRIKSMFPEKYFQGGAGRIIEKVEIMNYCSGNVSISDS